MADCNCSSRVIHTRTGEQQAQAVSLTPPFLEFGSVDVGEISGNQTTTVRNVGFSDLTVSSIQAVGAFNISHTAPMVLRPNETFVITVNFEPEYNGTTTGGIYIMFVGMAEANFVQLLGTGIGYESGDSALAAALAAGTADVGGVTTGELAAVLAPYDNLAEYFTGLEEDIAEAGTGGGGGTIEEYPHVTAIIALGSGLVTNKIYRTALTVWKVVTTFTPIAVSGGRYLKAIGSVYVEDFNDGIMTIDQYVTMAHNYCRDTNTRNKLVFDHTKIYNFAVGTSFEIFVESGGWHSDGMCALRWAGDPTQGYAIKIRGRYTTSDTYSTRLNNSNNVVMKGFCIGENGAQRRGSGLQIGHATTRTSSGSAVAVTSKFKVSNVNVFDFDDVVDFWTGSWAVELEHVNTIGGSWRTPSYFSGIDFGENMKLTHCFIADNHLRLADGEFGRVVFSAGFWIVDGGSFDNMRVTVEGDANVKMFGPHFENPASTAKNKRFLEVTGLFAFCALIGPYIVIRNTAVYSNLFYCLQGTDAARHPYAGGLSIVAPNMSSVSLYRPDNGIRQGAIDAVTYETDGFLELVGGGGRVYLEGSIGVNSLYFTYFPIPIARNLVGRSLANCDFEGSAAGTLPRFWKVDTVTPNTGVAVVSNDTNWVGSQCLKTTVDYNGGASWNSSYVYQDVPCGMGNLCLGAGKVKWVIRREGGATGPVTGGVSISVAFLDEDKNQISVGWSTNYTVADTDSASSFDGWMDLKLISTAPNGTKYARVQLSSFSSSDNSNKKIDTYWDAIVFNVT